MKTITVVVSDGQVSAMDTPENVHIRIVNYDDSAAPVKLKNGLSATVTDLPSDAEQMKDLYPNGRTRDGLPHRPDLVYADEWQGWADFLGVVPEVEANR